VGVPKVRDVDSIPNRVVTAWSVWTEVGKGADKLSNIPGITRSEIDNRFTKAWDEATEMMVTVGREATMNFSSNGIGA
jgi:hypothetical protein